MKPWQQKWLLEQEAERSGRPVCRCCGEPVATELWLDLMPFGIGAAACERCVKENLYPTY